MNEDWLKSQESGGVCGAEGDPDYAPDMAAIRTDYRWTPACQRAFLEELACTGSVMRSVKHVGKTARAAYGLRYRREGAAFRLGWDAAILIARATLADMLMDRAINGYEEMTLRQEDGSVMRGKFDNRLGIGLLTRLDRISEAQAAQASGTAPVQLVLQDFEAFLDLIENGGAGAEAALFLAARDDAPMAAMEASIQCELAQISADEADEADASEPEDIDPEDAAAKLSVWFDGFDEQWKTNFPPRDAEDAAEVEEDGLFGDPDYERTLTGEEQEAQFAVIATQTAPLRIAALKARDAWFEERLAA